MNMRLLPGLVGKSAILLGLCCLGVGCTDLYSGSKAEEAAAAIVKKTGRDSLRIYVVEVTPEQLSLRVEDPEKPGTLQEWWYYKGEAYGPKRVDLIGDGSLEPGLFPLSDVSFGAIAGMARDAKALWDIEAHTMELRVREDVASQKLALQWKIEGKKDSVMASKEGVVPVPTATRVARHADRGEWESALELCDYSYMKHDPALLAACDKIWEPAFAELVKSGKQSKLRPLCYEHKLRLSETLASVCARTQSQ
jgi:hypothetical protein